MIPNIFYSFNVAKKLAERGASVVMVDILERVGLESQELLERQYGKNRALFLRADITTPQ